MKAIKKIENGTPILEIDGRPPSPGFGRLQQPNYWALEKLDQFLKPGYNLFFVQLGSLNSCGWCWDGGDGYRYEQYEILMQSIIEKKPDSRLIPFLGGRPPSRWQKNHPNDMILTESGKRLNVASTDSPAWIQDSSEAVRRFVEHFESGPLADHIAGYNPIYVCNEWLLGFGKESDYNPGTIARFRAWLQSRYDNDVQALREAWKDDAVAFDTAEIPRLADYQAHGLNGMFDRFEVYGEQAADYLRYNNESVARLLCAHARAVKEGCKGNKLVSVMFGYTYTYPVSQFSPAHSGHMALLTALDSPDIDIFHSPYDYFNRCVGGPHYSLYSTDTLMLHGKVFADQIDSKTHVHRMDRGNAQTPWESEQMIKRDVAHSLMRNAYHYYYEMNVPCWRGVEGVVEFRELDFMPDNVQDIMVKMRKVAEDNHDALPASTTEVALFTSRASNYYRAYDIRYGLMYLQGLRSYFLPYTGAPFHDYLLEDFENLPQDYKVYIFPDAQYIPSDLRAAIRSKLERLGATALWFYAPGYIDETGSGVEHMEAATGIRFRKRPDLRDYLMIDFDRYDHPITQGLEKKGFFGSDMPGDFFQSKQEWKPWDLGDDRDNYKLSPFFTVDDPDAEALGTLRGSREPGLAVKDVNGMKSVFCAAPFPPPELLRNIFRYAGVHLYSDRTDIIYANARYVVLCADEDGERTLRLPSKCTVRDAVDSDLCVENTDTVTFEAKQGETRVFKLIKNRE